MCQACTCPCCAAIPATVVAAASFDDAIAITGYTLFIDLAVRAPGNTVWAVMHGPLSLLFGVLTGLAAGGVCSMTKLWNNSLKRTAVMFFTSALLTATNSVALRLTSPCCWLNQLLPLLLLQNPW